MNPQLLLTHVVIKAHFDKDLEALEIMAYDGNVRDAQKAPNTVLPSLNQLKEFYR